MGINYNQTADAQATAGGSYFKDGDYTVEIVRCLEKKAQTDGSDLAIIEAEVVSSNNDAVPVGSTRSQIISFKHMSAHSNLKGFAEAAVKSMHAQGILEGEYEGPVNGDVIQAIMQEGIAVGTKMNLTCTTVKTKRGGDFTKHLWDVCEG